MGTVHDLLEQRGKQAVLALDIERNVVEAAANYLADEESGIGFLYSGWTQAALPHRRPPDDAVWQITSERVTLLVEPGRRPSTVEGVQPGYFGVPYGSRARLIMLYLQSEALRTGCREVELGKSLRAWLTNMGIPAGGRSINDVREQAERISRCRLTFHIATGSIKGGLVNQNIVDTAMFVESEDSAQGSLMLETAKLSEGFFEQLQRHPVPLEDAAIRAISNNSMALDIYCWLSYRLHALPSAKLVTWPALKAQFGVGYGKLAGFKYRFQPSLALAMAVYRDAKVGVEERGLMLHPSKPPVAPRMVKISR
jgi:hypothetical protein